MLVFTTAGVRREPIEVVVEPAGGRVRHSRAASKQRLDEGIMYSYKFLIAALQHNQRRTCTPNPRNSGNTKAFSSLVGLQRSLVYLSEHGFLGTSLSAADFVLALNARVVVASLHHKIHRWSNREELSRGFEVFQHVRTLHKQGP